MSIGNAALPVILCHALAGEDSCWPSVGCTGFFRARWASGTKVQEKHHGDHGANKELFWITDDSKVFAMAASRSFFPSSVVSVPSVVSFRSQVRTEAIAERP